jgi:hypothetical protein
MTLHTETITVLTPGEKDERGVTVPDWDEATETEEDGWNIQPTGGSEDAMLGRQELTERFRALGPYGSILTADCRVIYGGVTYEVDGPVGRWPSATGALAHVETTLKRVTG